MSISLRTLKGVGEKTEKLFAKIGVTDMESLLSYYPRNYDAYEEPVEIRSLEEGAVVAISVAVITGVYVNQVRNLQVITTTVAELTGKISVTWFNAPYLRSAVRKGSRFVLRGRVVRKQGKLQMEHPEIFTPAAYEEILHSLQPIYGLTAGLSNKTIVKLIHQVNEAGAHVSYMIVSEAGASVFPRSNDKLVGKGYALDYGLKAIWEQYADRDYEAFFVFDADNVLDVNYFREMNKTFDNGAKASTSYRNSKNYDSNWISAGYAVWFLREAKFLNQARLPLNTSCAVSGTGFFIAADIIEKTDGWRRHLLTKDIALSANSILEGIRIAYTPTAVLYDEQPGTFRDSWNQRFRWAKGFYQVFWHYGARLAKGVFTNPKGSRFACYDMLMTIAPGMLLSIISILFNTIIIVLAATGVMSTGVAIASSVTSVVFCLCNYIVFMFVFGVLTTFVEWDSIRTTTAKKIRYMFTFPFFMLTYIPIALIALVKKAAWKPIRHSISVDVAEFSEAEGVRLSSK